MCICHKNKFVISRFCEFCGALQVAGGGNYQQWISKPAKNNGKVWLIALSVAVVTLMITIVILVAGDGSSDRGRQNVSASVERIKIDFTAQEYYNKMTENEFVATEFQGKIVTISGTVDRVGRRMFTKEPYVDLYNSSLFNLCCEFSEDDIEMISDLKKKSKNRH